MYLVMIVIPAGTAVLKSGAVGGGGVSTITPPPQPKMNRNSYLVQGYKKQSQAIV